ncbi:MAG: lycopene cyclase domain-containing protein [Patescibacteria group bacterium]|nr:lycopene cyclase domain-containing protein [Patescibacteria group bacterium]
MAVWARHSEVKRLFVVMAALVTMTAVFDSLIIGLNLVNYNPAHILRVFIGKAPIEDFSYTIIAAILVPILWEQGAKHEK